MQSGMPESFDHRCVNDVWPEPAHRALVDCKGADRSRAPSYI
jgi:hypothetical protein